MKLIVLALCLIAVASAKPKSPRAAEPCDPEVCLAQNGCRCASLESPLPYEDTPQFVTFAFNDAVTDQIYLAYLLPLLNDRTNNDGSPIGATFYVPHEYTDYYRVHTLYADGFEIASHSISKTSWDSYWQDADLDTWIDEFQGQREIISNFANIPIDDVIGARVPNLQKAGDRTFTAFVESGVQYDNSWTTRSTQRTWPYTLDYLSEEACNVGTCPVESYPGFWILPIIDQTGIDNIECNAVFACTINATSTNDVKDWFMGQFNNHYEDNRAPITFTINSAWFATNEFHTEGFLDFLDDLALIPDVFVVSHSAVLDWMQDPVSVGNYTAPNPDRTSNCTPLTCELMKGEEFRYMRSCAATCPEVYPWVGNPTGSA